MPFPFLMGAMTFFLPCGFTITAQGFALISKSAVQGGLIMLLFALGTLPMFLGIGPFSLKFHNRPDLSKRFIQVAGVVVLFFALFSVNSQMNLLGLSNREDLAGMFGGSVRIARGSLPPIVDGKQVIEMEAFSYEYSPSYFRVRAGVPVRWEIADRGTSGCTNAIISNGLFEGEIPLSPGQVSTKEFTPLKVGRYKFSCWMGMVSGVIDVVGENPFGSFERVLSEGAEPLPLFGSALAGILS
ncbi:MAG: sulfite exporter TauE/SafE family protein [Actinomycetota bacterium]|nr:sulfite exporter TauE/SafE family protein [Actinomycetota bacterium]